MPCVSQPPPRRCVGLLEGVAGARDMQVIPAGRPVDGGPWVVESGGVTGRCGPVTGLFVACGGQCLGRFRFLWAVWLR
jgi:hypothetical protein